MLLLSGNVVTAENTVSRVFTNTAELRGLTIPQAGRGQHIQLEGVVTFVDANRNFFVLQDESGALAINLDLAATKVQSGERIRLKSDSAFPTIAAFPEFPAKPAGSELRSLFSGPTNWGVFYLDRLCGFLTPPVTGDYTFYIASKGASELWLGTNSDSSTVRRIAFVRTGRSTLPAHWSKYPEQSSAPVRLAAGQSYWIEAIHEQHSGRDDNVSVAWQGPGIVQSVIEGQFLSPDLTQRTNGIIREYWNDFFASSVEPFSSSGEISAITVNDSRIETLAAGTLPQPMPVQIGAPASPRENYRWSELEGVVRFVAVDEGGLVLELGEHKERVQARVRGWAGTNAAQFEKMRVRLRGVCETVSDRNGSQRVGIIWVPSPQYISQVEADAASFSSIQTTPISELKPENPALAWGRRVRVRGSVVRIETNGIILQGADSIGGYVSSNGMDWKPIAPPLEVEMSHSALAGLAVSSFAPDTLATATFTGISGWKKEQARNTDIFDAAPPGKVMFENSDCTIQGGGQGISSSFDQFHFVYQPGWSGDAVIARVKNFDATNPRAEAGIMIRDSLDSRSGFAGVAITTNGAVFQFRQKQGERGATVNLPSVSAPCWLKLTRRHFQVLLHPDNNFSWSVGEKVDVVGLLKWENHSPILASAQQLAAPAKKRTPLPRWVATTSTGSNEPPVVQLAPLIPEDGEDLREGSGTIRVRGVVTFSGAAPDGNYLAIQDDTAGVFVRLSQRFLRRPLQIGDWVEFGLTSVNGKWPVPLEPVRVQVLGRGQLPEPELHPAEYSLPRRGDGHWTEFEGVIRGVTDNGQLSLMCRDGKISVWIGGAPTESLRSYADSLVRVRGVLFGNMENSRTLLVPSPEFVQCTEPAPGKPFIVPTLAISELKNFSRRATAFHRVKISGVVTYQQDGLLVVQDASGGVRVWGQLSGSQVGDLIEAAGFPDSDNGVVSLTGSVVRKIGFGELPPPIEWTGDDLQQKNPDARTVRLAGNLLSQRTVGGNQILELQSGPRIYRATLANRCGELQAIPPGSIIQVTGVCWAGRIGNDSEAADEPLVSSVLLRTPSDVIVRQRPPWWTWKHTAATIAALVIVLAAALLWIRVLHRQVTQRTRELQSAMSKLERETEVSATLAERNRLAGELHDGLEQGLTGIMMQLDGLESKLEKNPAEAARYLRLARNMIRFSRTEVRHSLWDWKSPALANNNLGVALNHIATQMSAGNETRVTVEISGQPFSLPRATEHHLLRIGQEALHNALKYAHAEIIRVSLNYSKNLVHLSIRDNGQGFVPEMVLNDSAGHLGLQSLRSRARKIGGNLTVTSAPNEGATIDVVVPLREDNSHPGQTNPPLSQNEN